MKKLIVKAPVKLNLNLHVLPKKINGFHQIKSINCQLAPPDELCFEQISNNIEIICDQPQVPKGENSLIYRAAVLLKKLVNNPSLGAKITLKKHIPVKVGLGGGSSDAAATLRGLMKLWNIKLTGSQLFNLAEKLGKDVHYCLRGGLCEVGGDGSTIIPLRLKMPKFWLMIIIPEEEKPSTKFMYENLDTKKIGRNIKKLGKLKKAIQMRKRGEILDNLFNDFENLAIHYFPIVKKIKSDLLKESALKTLLAGSGLSVIGFFNSKSQSERAVNNLKVKHKNIIWAKTL